MQAVVIGAPEAAAVPPEHVPAQPGMWRRDVAEAVGRLVPLEDRVRDEHPDVSRGIARHGAGEHRGQAVLGCVGVEFAAPITRDAAALRAEPQVVVIAVKRGEAVGPDGGCVVFVEDGELHAVEADCTVQRGQPQIAVGCLMDSPDDVLREAAVGGPYLVAERGSGSGEHRARCHNKHEPLPVSCMRRAIHRQFEPVSNGCPSTTP